MGINIKSQLVGQLTGDGVVEKVRLPLHVCSDRIIISSLYYTLFHLINHKSNSGYAESGNTYGHKIGYTQNGTKNNGAEKAEQTKGPLQISQTDL